MSLNSKIIKRLNESDSGVDWGYFDKFDHINDEYLPQSGEGETMASQIVTAINKLVYKWYNDGDVYDNSRAREGGMTGWANDLSSYANWLANNVDGARSILNEIFSIGASQDGKYEQLLKRLADSYLNEDFLKGMAEHKKVGSIYDCSGDYSFDERWDYDEEEW